MPSLITFPRWQDAEPATLRGCVVAVIDVLRWSTVVITTLAHGANAVEAYATPDDARARADALGRSRVLLGGERENLPLPGFDVGNSPAEYSPTRVAGRTVVTTTTNGTQALLVAREAEEVLIAAFVNLDMVVWSLRRALTTGRDVALIAAGQAGHEAQEDTACAGAIAEELSGLGTADELSHRAIALWRRHDRNPVRVLSSAPHAKSLRTSGFDADVDFAARRSVFSEVPRAKAHLIAQG